MQQGDSLLVKWPSQIPSSLTRSGYVVCLFVNTDGKKKESQGFLYPTGVDQLARPNDPERLQIALQGLPPFTLSDQKLQYGIYRAEELGMGSFPSPSGLEISWESSSEGVEIFTSCRPLQRALKRETSCALAGKLGCSTGQSLLVEMASAFMAPIPATQQ